MSRIDYFAYTFAGMDTSSPNFYDVFLRNFDLFLPKKIGQYIVDNHLESVVCASAQGYRRRITYPNIGISIMYQGITPKHGCHVVLSGTILSLVDMTRADYQSFVDNMDDRIEYIKTAFFCDQDVWFRVSRCDIAYDFGVPFCDFLSKFNSGCFLTSIRSSKTILDSRQRGTIYLGSRKSAVFIRIYDKSLEQSDKTMSLFGFVDPDLPDNWTRLEFEFKNDFKARIAELAFNAYLSGDGDIGDFCVKYLYLSDNLPYQNRRANADPCQWYFDVIRQNNNCVEIEYNDSFVRGRVNLVYLQTMYNMLITYFKQVSGLSDYLAMMFRPSKSVCNKNLNICLDEIFAMAKDNFERGDNNCETDSGDFGL